MELAQLEAAAEATTKPRRRRPVALEPPPACGPAAPRPADGSKPWFRDGDKVMTRMFDVMAEAGPNKLAVFRAKFAEGQDQHAEFEALSQTQQNGILIRAMDRLMADGKLTRDGLIYGVK